MTDVAVVSILDRYRYFHAPRREVHLRHVFLLTPTAPLPKRWTHEVGGGGDDRGLRFECYWIDATHAAATLAVGPGLYVDPAQVVGLLPPCTNR